MRDKNGTPFFPDANQRNQITESLTKSDELKLKFIELYNKLDSGLIFWEKGYHRTIDKVACNLNLSQCYNCDKVAVWVHRNLIHPNKKCGVLPNDDLPAEIIRDYEEARGILNDSPRGAAALLRLCVQKLCIHLGEKGKNIDDDIASLVSKGLNPLVQKSLDIVRVIGNEAVHPGVLDLKDDRDTAIQLLGLINCIADRMISDPKKVDEIYGNLPQNKLEAIENRDIRRGKTE